MSGVRRYPIERHAKNGFSPVPRPERAELPDDIELRQCPSGILTASDSCLRLRQGDYVRHLRELTEHGIGGRAGAATL